jgi:hypothetical protein
MQPPDVHITVPVDGTVYPAGTQIILMGGALDAEDGPLGDSALEWFLEGMSLETGKELAMSGRPLAQLGRMTLQGETSCTMMQALELPILSGCGCRIGWYVPGDLAGSRGDQ